MSEYWDVNSVTQGGSRYELESGGRTETTTMEEKDLCRNGGNIRSNRDE